MRLPLRGKRPAVRCCGSAGSGSRRCWTRRGCAYGADAFCQVLAQKLALTLVTPPDDLLLHLPTTVVKRAVRATTVGQIESLAFPMFVKSYIPKLIRSRVYASAAELTGELKGLEPEAQLLVSEVIALSAEARTWVLDGEVLSIACYEGVADLADARALAKQTARAAHPRFCTGETASATAVPSPCVIDVGLTPDRGWVVVEANAAWGAGLNGCDATAAARCIARASHAS